MAAWSTGLAADLAARAEQLRRITVEVRGGRAGQGTGVVWRSDGLIVTNAHVARSDATVVLADGRVLEGRLLAWDATCDLAVLAVAARDLAVAETRDTDTLRVGELVLAVGNPFGLAGALTSGVIHALGLQRGARWVSADLRLAPGNSGGPLADVRGRVVGVNTMIAGGLALAVPANAVTRFLERAAGRGALAASAGSRS